MQYKIHKRLIITLLHLPEITRKKAFKLLENLDRDIQSLGDLIEHVARYSDDDYLSLLSISDFDTAFNRARQIIKDSEASGINIISILDDAYPPLLRYSDDPPVMLNYIGDIGSLITKPTICITGTRKPTEFGKLYSYKVGRFFARKGFNVVSGLAKGCDTMVHLGAVDAKAVTTAVVAHGLDTVFPQENAPLANRIKQTGVVLSEYFIGIPVTKQNMMERNRIQAALSLGTFIIESDVKSETMHTANYAVAYKRILACMKPPLEHFKETRVVGNMSLTRAGKAVGIYDDPELNEFAVLLKDLFQGNNK